ncbi:MAG: hypothetical protein PHU49_04790 [Syntrophorhabdaceae bacterium]|jgi:hypothetical protein|nr:hypothetical protein [Syntrophorhabdaceae bacterium]MDD5243313.1 hypothetical protein [Syntrophorhabdaceae bacterium]
MPVNNRIGSSQGSLRVAVDEEYRGIKDLDFFADHTQIQSEINLIPRRFSTSVDELYLRTVLTSITCPKCKQPVRRSYRRHPKEWFLKFAGRKILYCTSCDWHEIVKVNRWEWEIIATVLAVTLIVSAASIHWILR